MPTVGVVGILRVPRGKLTFRSISDCFCNAGQIIRGTNDAAGALTPIHILDLLASHTDAHGRGLNEAERQVGLSGSEDPSSSQPAPHRASSPSPSP